VLICGSCFQIRPVAENELETMINVYRQCEDFLALGPEPTASAFLVRKDMADSQTHGGVFCGVFDSTGAAIGVLDCVPGGFEGNPHHAFISLLMLAAPQRRRGLGAEIVERVEKEIRQDTRVTAVLAAVQTNNPAAIRFWQKHGYQITGGPELQPDRTVVYPLRKEL